MKTLIFRSKTVLIGVALLIYVVWLFIQGKTVGTTESLTLVAIVFAAALALYLIAIIVFKGLMPTNRYTIGLIGLVTILFANLYMVDDPSKYVYLADIMKLIGVFLVIAGPMKLLFTKKMEDEQFEKKVEIIEV